MAALHAPPAAVLPIPPRVRIRPLEPPDAWVLDAVHAGLSDASRYTRYHGPKPRFGSAERAYLTATDGRDHIALVALGPQGEPLGIARSVRLREDPSAAEIAAEVVDAWQRHGLGSTLIRSLARRAAGAGVARFRASVLAQTGLSRSLRRRGWHTVASDGLTVTLEISVWALAGSRP
jgi:GNAT superfamily N-acetyltransferase